MESSYSPTFRSLRALDRVFHMLRGNLVMSPHAVWCYIAPFLVLKTSLDENTTLVRSL